MINLSQELQEFLEAQPVFFVGTAPLSAQGHINISPKGGLGTFRVLSPSQVAYCDLTGSGAETVAHLKENGRIVVMFTAFEGRPRIVRLHGRGRVVERGSSEFDELRGHFIELAGQRCVIVVDVERVSSSCGYAVPFMDFVGERDQLNTWAEKKGEEGLVKYRMEKNLQSIDGLPSLDVTLLTTRDQR